MTRQQNRKRLGTEEPAPHRSAPRLPIPGLILTFPRRASWHIQLDNSSSRPGGGAAARRGAHGLRLSPSLDDEEEVSPESTHSSTMKQSACCASSSHLHPASTDTPHIVQSGARKSTHSSCADAYSRRSTFLPSFTCGSRCAPSPPGARGPGHSQNTP